MTGFKTAKRTGISVSAGDRALVGVVTVEVGGLTETIQVTSEAALVNTQSGERSFTVTTDSVENLPIANRSFTALASLAPGVTGTTRIGGGGGNNIMMDGVSAVDTGSNAILLQMNVESIAEVKVLVSGYQAEYGRSSGLQITAVTKSGTNQFRGSTLRRLAQFRLVLQQPDEHSERRSQDRPAGKGSGLLDRRPGRETGRQEQALLLLQPRVCAANRRERRPALPDADGARAGRGLLADDRQQRRAVPVHQGSQPHRRMLGDEPGRLLPGRRRARAYSGQPALRHGPEHPEDVPDAERQRSGRRVQLRDHQADREPAPPISRPFASTTSR